MNSPLRGDYSRAALDYSVEQDWARYSAARGLYRRPFERQSAGTEIRLPGVDRGVGLTPREIRS
jgi:hypothetical protein